MIISIKYIALEKKKKKEFHDFMYARKMMWGPKKKIACEDLQKKRKRKSLVLAETIFVCTRETAMCNTVKFLYDRAGETNNE